MCELLVRSRPNADESACGYLFRLAQENALATLAPLVCAPGRRATRFTIASSLGLRYEDLEALLPPWPPWVQDRWLGHDGPRRVINLRRIRFCPLCMEESCYHRHTWMLVFSVVCPYHGVGLRESCDLCGATFSWRSGATWVCPCGRQFQSMSAELASPILAEFTSVLLGPERVCTGEAFASIARYFEQLKREQKTLVAHEVGRLSLSGTHTDGVKRKGLYELRAARVLVRELAELFVDWPMGIRKLVERLLSEETSLPPLLRLTPVLNVIYGPALRDPVFDFLRTEFTSCLAACRCRQLPRSCRRMLGPYLQRYRR